QSAGSGAVEVRVPNNFYRDWIKDHYSEEIRRAAFSALGQKPPIVFVVCPDLVAAPATGGNGSSGATGASAKPPQRQKNQNFFAAHSDVQLNKSFTFANFVVGPNNQLCHAAAQAVVANPGKSYNPLFVHGSVGLGKTHLLQAICHALLGREQPINILYLSCETFVNH